MKLKVRDFKINAWCFESRHFTLHLFNLSNPSMYIVYAILVFLGAPLSQLINHNQYKLQIQSSIM